MCLNCVLIAQIFKFMQSSFSLALFQVLLIDFSCTCVVLSVRALYVIVVDLRAFQVFLLLIVVLHHRLHHERIPNWHVHH